MIRRNVQARLLRALGDTPVVLLNGARQTGKSTLAQALAGGDHPAAYFTLDDATVLNAAATDGASFIAGLPERVVLDEVQRVPALFLALKAEVDRRRQSGRFLLTGSANVWTLPRLADSLAGRMEVVSLWPFSQGELEGRRESFLAAAFSGAALPTARSEAPESLCRRVLRGGYPEPAFREDAERRAAWFGSYLTTVLQRDIRELANIGGLTELPRLLSFLAARTASLLNVSELGRAAGMPHTTLSRYLALLQATFLVVQLPAWSRNPSKRLSKMPKVFLNDTGLAAHLLGMDEARALRDRDRFGPLLENFVAMELMKQATWAGFGVALLHFRTQTGREVDLVLEGPDGRVVGIEVKAAAQVAASDFNGLRSLREILGGQFVRGIVLYTGPQVVAFGDDLQAAPVATLWA